MKYNKGFAGIGLVIAVIVALVVGGGVVYYATKTKAPSTENIEGTSYNGSKFSLSYPNEYTLTENSDGITITSVPLKKIDTAQCQQLEDEQARGNCRNPASGISPFITIKFLAGNPSDLWEKAIFGTDNGTFVANSKYTYKYNHIGDEFGGIGSYGLFLSNGLLLATYIHQDVEGGSQFDFLKSSEYRLNQHQQKELLEQILKTLVTK